MSHHHDPVCLVISTEQKLADPTSIIYWRSASGFTSQDLAQFRTPGQQPPEPEGPGDSERTDEHALGEAR